MRSILQNIILTFQLVSFHSPSHAPPHKNYFPVSVFTIQSTVWGKDKVNSRTQHDAVKVVWASGCNNVNLETWWRWAVSFTLRLLHPLHTQGTRPLYPLDTRLAGYGYATGRDRKLSSLAGNRSSVLQPAASPVTHTTIMACKHIADSQE
jgi:hypothetical protein